MPKGKNQKLKLCYLKEILLNKTDAEHGITLAEIMDELEKREVTAERKSLYSDIAELENLGITVEKCQKDNTCYYKVVKREFELAELKMLVDAIQSSKFITERQSRELIKKIENFTSEHQARKLQRQIYVQGRIKTKNESVYDIVDAIYTAIENNKKIKFKYLQWNIKKEMEERHDGKWYDISPWALIWYAENYYLVAFDNEEKKIKHFRIDKMRRIVVGNELREGKDEFKHFSIAEYSNKVFGMYGGQEERVVVTIKNEMIGIFLDRFGKDVSVFRTDSQHVEVRIPVAVSNQFYGWIFGLGPDVKITGPKKVVEEAREYIQNLGKQYSE